MLSALTIQNVVLIDRLSLEFKSGFCALTGETGAGKSILLDALGLALGVRAEAGLVRAGADQATVSAEFHVKPGHPVFDLLREQDLAAGEGAMILRRTVGTDGRSRAFINDQPVSVTLLRQVGALLVEIHGQFDAHGLMDPGTHRDLLDEYAGVESGGLVDAWQEWKDAGEKFRTAQDEAVRARAEEDYLRGSVQDLDDLNPQPGEEEKLAALKERLKRRDQVLENLRTADEGLGEAESLLNLVWRALDKTGDGAAPLLAAIDRALSEIREAGAGVQSQSADLQDSAYSLSEIDDRLFTLRGQARKHGVLCDDLPRVRDDLAARLALIDRQDDILGDLKKKEAAARTSYVAAAEALSEKRRAVASRLDKEVAKELPPLKLDKARFETIIDRLDEVQWGPAGIDRVRFLVATNPGSAPGALDKIASGGERARFMLALKVVLAATGAAGTLIFDEVDAGIGGPTAAAVGERLARLAKDRQILVVTHAPQVAARAAHHWIVTKDGRKDVKTTVLPLAEAAARREEIARMLAGAEITAEARAAAGKLLETGT